MVILDNDRYDRVYRDLPAHSLVLKKVPICEYCGAIKFPSEGPGFCCRQGKVNIVNTPVLMNCADFSLVKRIEMRCVSEKIYGTSIHISLSLALELLWINGSLLLLVIISCQYSVHCNLLKSMILHILTY